MRRKKLKLSCRSATLITIGLIGVALSLCGLLWRVFYREYLPIMQVAEVEHICQLLQLSDQDAFCASSSEQNIRTFLDLLKRNFPVQQTAYDDIMPLLETVPAHPSYHPIPGDGVFTAGACPDPRERGREYVCYMELADTIGHLWIIFDEEGVVIDYRAGF